MLIYSRKFSFYCLVRVITKSKRNLFITMVNLHMNQECEHFQGVDEASTSPSTKGCEECEKEGTDWVALRMCIVCGHVGCCDSSIGLHARKHYENTGHPVMIALPDKSWRWCYEHKQYY
jgi:uncharacterized UBP type Zn finger protein